ncbi:extracellular solute-binding protein [Paenibacillus sp. PL2-23]|uniref:extracellular solute-binding protein n=1 Tax=Paenibacillus sp. PL2-23 TaxID=2100729 RepID=UPI0040469A2D
MVTVKKTKASLLAAVLSVFMILVSVTAACSSNSEEASQSSNSPTQSAAPQDNTNEATTYPIQTDKKLTYWAGINSNLAGIRNSLDEVPFFQEWQKRTGVPLTFISPTAGQQKEALNVMLASGELPDVIEYSWINFPGGPEKAIKDGYILRLNELMDQHAPNLKKYLEEHPEVDRLVKTDSGSYYGFPFIRGDESLLVFSGPIVRQDWLDELGLEVPTTIDEWYTVLKAFKEKKGASAPLSFLSEGKLAGLGNGAIIGAFGINQSFYLDNGQIKYGPAEPQYKDFLATMSKWYAEGLLDKNIATTDLKTLDANMISGATGVTLGNAGSHLGKWTPLLSEKDPKAVLAPAPYPVMNKGDVPRFGQLDNPFAVNGTAAITSKSKNPELAVKMLDYAYSEEGHMLFNFGVEGVSYTMENGYPTYTDLMMKNPDKLAPAQALSLYIRGNYFGPFVQDKRYSEQYNVLQSQKDSIEVWKTDAKSTKLPPITATPEESTELAKIMTDVETLVNEMTLKIILGSEPLSSYDSYMKKLETLNFDRAIEIQKAALERFNKR